MKKIMPYALGITAFLTVSSIVGGNIETEKDLQRKVIEDINNSVSIIQPIIAQNKVFQLENKWIYSDNKNTINEDVRTASVISKNKIKLSFPYDREQNGFLVLRKHPKYGFNIMFGIEQGQIHCRIKKCKVLVKFDDGNAMKFSATKPSDNSSDLIFLNKEKKFLKNLAKSQIVRIQVKFYYSGTRVFEFQTKHLDVSRIDMKINF